MTGRIGRLALRAAAAAALLLAYEVALRPSRAAFVDAVALPTFEAIDTPRSAKFDLVRETALTVRAVPRGDRREPLHYAAPAGALFLLGGLFLVVLFPLRPYWLVLLGYHLSLGVIAFALFALGLGWWEPAFHIFRFSRTYASDLVGLLVPLVLFLRGRATESRGHMPGAPPRVGAGLAEVPESGVSERSTEEGTLPRQFFSGESSVGDGGTVYPI